jgi:hypothetical protein
LSSEFVADTKEAISFSVVGIEHDQSLLWGYQPGQNCDPDGDSDGMIISMTRPEPIAMFIKDLDGVSFQASNSDWKATAILVLVDADQNPVVDAEVNILWNNGKSAGCTTDENGQCLFTSDKLKFNDYDTITLTIDNITHDQILRWSYDATLNMDPDDDSDGTVILIEKP